VLTLAYYLAFALFSFDMSVFVTQQTGLHQATCLLTYKLFIGLHLITCQYFQAGRTSVVRHRCSLLTALNGLYCAAVPLSIYYYY